MSSPALRIRDFRPEDFEMIYKIDQICFPADIAFSRNDFVFCLSHPGSIAFLAEEMSGIAGFVLARIETRSRAHVLTLDVVPELRGRSVGTKLMNRLHETLQGQRIRVSLLEVGIQNIAAQRLYEKLGYEVQGLLRGYYQGREDAYRMRRLSETYGAQLSPETIALW
jgi:ribosomal-protein-alanine N-acetyltransferase